MTSQMLVELGRQLVDLGSELSALILDASGKAVDATREPVDAGVETRPQGIDPVPYVEERPHEGCGQETDGRPSLSFHDHEIIRRPATEKKWEPSAASESA